MKERLLISFSGGRTSAFMTNWLLKNKQRDYEIIVVFANTGKEREETLEFVRNCDTYLGFNTIWIEAITHLEHGKGVTAKVVSCVTASRKGEPFEAFIQKHGIPNMSAPKCARELKAYAIRAYARSIGWQKYSTAIGIRADEPHRINLKTAKKEKLIYPLAQMIRVTKSDINLFWSRQNFDLNLASYEGNCDLCWKKSLRKLMTIAADQPQLADWWREMETKYGTLIPPARRENSNIRLPIRFYRDHMSIDDIREEANFQYDPAIDESKLTDPAKQLALFNEFMDIEDAGCSASCEAY